MKHKILLLIVALYITGSATAQSDQPKAPTVFDRISKEMEGFKVNTDDPPNDKLTRTINELRELRGGFNINEAIEFKIAQDRKENNMTSEELDQLAIFFNSGAGKQQLDNAVTWIYRNYFTYKEMKEMTKFYRTSAGQKMATHFPVVMLQSLAAAMAIKNTFQGSTTK